MSQGPSLHNDFDDRTGDAGNGLAGKSNDGTMYRP